MLPDMGRMIDGRWTTQWYSPDEKGRFQREATSFHDRVEKAEAGRYHLYGSLACP